MNIPLQDNQDFQQFSYPPIILEVIKLLNARPKSPLYFFTRMTEFPMNAFHIEYVPGQAHMLMQFVSSSVADQTLAYLKESLPQEFQHDVCKATIKTLSPGKNIKTQMWALKLVFDIAKMIGDQKVPEIEEKPYVPSVPPVSRPVQSETRKLVPVSTNIYPLVTTTDGMKAILNKAKVLLQERKIKAGTTLQKGDYSYSVSPKEGQKASILSFGSQQIAEIAYKILQVGLGRPVYPCNKTLIVIAFDHAWTTQHVHNLHSAIIEADSLLPKRNYIKANKNSLETPLVKDELSNAEDILQKQAARAERFKRIKTAFKSQKMVSSLNLLTPKSKEHYSCRSMPVYTKPYDVFRFRDNECLQKAKHALAAISEVDYEVVELAIFIIADAKLFNQYQTYDLIGIAAGTPRTRKGRKAA